METLYKLTNAANQSKGGMQWGEGVTHHADARLPAKLCTEGVIHAYRSPELAAMMAPAHVDDGVRTLWVAEGEVCADDGTKVGVRALTTLCRAELPEPTTTQRVAFGILAALEVERSQAWRKWAEEWLSGKDRSRASACAAAYAAACAAAYAAESAEWEAAESAAYAAREAACAAKEIPIDLSAIARKAMRDYA